MFNKLSTEYAGVIANYSTMDAHAVKQATMNYLARKSGEYSPSMDISAELSKLTYKFATLKAMVFVNLKTMGQNNTWPQSHQAAMRSAFMEHVTARAASSRIWPDIIRVETNITGTTPAGTALRDLSDALTALSTMRKTAPVTTATADTRAAPLKPS